MLDEEARVERVPVQRRRDRGWRIGGGTGNERMGGGGIRAGVRIDLVYVMKCMRVRVPVFEYI